MKKWLYTIGALLFFLGNFGVCMAAWLQSGNHSSRAIYDTFGFSGIGCLALGGLMFVAGFCVSVFWEK